MAAEWARFLTDDDEWVVRTALSCAAQDLDRFVAESLTNDTRLVGALVESATRYRDVLSRIEEADA